MISSNLELALQELEKAPRSVKKITLEPTYFNTETGAVCSCGHLAIAKGMKPAGIWEGIAPNGFQTSCYDFIRKEYNLTVDEADAIIYANFMRKTFKGVVNMVRKYNGDTNKLRNISNKFKKQ